MPTERAIERANQIAGQYGGNTQTTAGANSSRPSAIPSTQGSTVQSSAPNSWSGQIQSSAPNTQSSATRIGTPSALARADAIFAQYGERAAAAQQQAATGRTLQNSGLVSRSETQTSYTPAQRRAWETRRSELQTELDDWWNNAGWVMTEDQASAYEQRRRDILAELDDLDRKIWSADNPSGGEYTPQNYEGIAGRARDTFTSATGDYLSGHVNFFGTLLDALRAGVNTNPNAGYITDELAASQIGYEHDEDKMGDYEWMRTGAETLEAAADTLGEDAAAEIQRAKQGLSDLGQAGVDIASNVLQMGYDFGIGRLTGSSLVPLFVRSAGSAAREARQAGANVDQQFVYGMTKGGIEVLTEKLFDGVAHIYGAGAADEITEELIRRMARSDTGRTVLRALIGAVGEGGEEVISDLLAPYAELIYKSGSPKELFLNTFNGTYVGSELLYDFLIGAVIGGLGGAASIATGQNAAANTELSMRDAGIGSVENQTANAWDVLTGRRTAEQVQAQEQQARRRLGIDNALDTASSAELKELRDLAGQALNTLELDDQTKAQLRVLRTAADAELRERGEISQNAAPDNGSGAVNNNVNGGTPYVENQAQEEQGVLGQTETVPPAGEQAGGIAAPDAAAVNSAAGAEAAQPVGAEAPGGSGGRYAGPGFRGESERVVRSAEERRQRADEQGRRATARQALGTSLWEKGEVRLQSAQELGVQNGSETQDLKVFPQEYYDEEMRDVADWVASEYGLPVTFVSGIIHVNDGSGNLYRVRGVYTGNGIILQADNRNESITSLARHEVFHDEAARDAALVDAIRAELVARYSPEEMRQILRGYIINMRGEISVDENADMDQLDEAAMRIFEEVCADAAGGINAFGLGAYQYENTVNRVRGERAALREQANGERETRGPPKQRASYGGELADNADFAALDVAQEMEQEGADPETIRQDTGWFRGMDGKWRFEIDDSGMQYNRWGDAQFRQDHPEYAEYQDLMGRVLTGELTQEESERLHELDGTWGNELERLNELVDRGRATLSMVLNHPALFEAYPQLRKTRVAFRDMKEGTTGSYDRNDNTIWINSKLRKDPGSTLIHEIQHAIQSIEGFANGSSPAAWSRRLDNGYAERRRSAEFEAADKAYRELFDSAPEELKNKIRELNRAKLNSDLDLWDQLEAELYDGPYGDLFMEIDKADFERRRIRDQDREFDAYDLYRNTAGEIEARDAQRRRPWDYERRRNTPPDLGDEDTVFAEEGDESFSLRDKKIPTREELEAKDDIPVVDIREDTSGSYKEQREAFLNSEEAQELYREPALNRDTNEPLFITPKSITHTFNNAGQENILLAKHLREIAENAVLTHGEPSRSAPDDHTTGVYKFFGAVQTPDGVQPVKLTVKEYNVEGQDVPKAVLDYVGDLREGDTYAPIYDGKVLVLEDVEKETSSSAPSSTRNKSEPDKHPSVSTISVKDLLDLVKGEDAKYIPQRETSESTRYSADDSEIPGAIWGDEDETYVNDNEPVRFRWAIVPAESLILSNDASGSINPAYPAELQPRDRTRPESQMQIQKISQDLNPRKLESSAEAQNGAPIIRNDGVVISGNGRGLGIRDAYDKGRADAYRDYIQDKGSRFGLDTSDLPEHPVLVRVAEDVDNWAKLARDSNTSTVAVFSATERAMADAARMDSRIMAMLNPDEDGNINSAANKDFIQSFVANVIPDSERGAAITGSGLLSQDGLERAEYAIFAAAYQDAELMQRMSESLDNDMKNVTNGLLDIAPKVMQYQAAVDAGQMYDTRATENLLAAVRLYTEAKRSGMTVEERTANQNLTDDFTDEIIYTARIIEKFKRSAKQIRTFFNGLYDEIESYGDPNQLNFFGEEESHDYREALEGAIKRYERATDTQLPSLGDWGAGWYEATDRGNETKAAEPVHESPDSGSGESDGGAGRVEPEIPEDTGLHLPPPPGTETEAAPAPKPESETRQRDLERMAKRREKDGQKKQKQRKPPKFPFAPEYDPLTQYKDAADPVKEFIKAAQARAAAAKAERAMQADKRNFTGSPALQKLGVHIQNSVGNYAHVDQLLARERAAYQLRKMIRRREAALNATAKEKAFASGMAAGIYTAEDIPANMNRAKLEELADYYWAEKAVASDMIAQRRKDINLGLDAQMDELLKDSDLYKVPPAIVLNYRTPERLCKTIWGDEHGQAIYDAIFRPVSVNEAEKTRFINRMFDEVRTFEGKDGKSSELTKEERVLTQQVLEGRAVQELVASMEMHEAVENAAQNILNGSNSGDAAREFSLTDDEKGIAEQYARWLQTQAIYDSGDFDTVKIDNAVKKYSEMYDKMYDAINDFLVAHGYDPIGFIKGYAPHMQMGEDLNLFAGYLDRLGFNTNVTRLPASIAGKTADYKPNKRWNPYFLQRVGDMTDFDIAKGYQSYVNYLSDVLYHTDDIMRIRAMSRYYRRTFAPDEIRETLDWVHYNENASPEVKEEMLKDRGIIARDSKLSQRDVLATFDEWVDKQYESVENMTKYSDYVSYLDNYANILAGKQSSIDRGAEALLGRESLTWGNKLVNSFARTQVAGSFSSALNQSAQLPQIRAELGAKYTAKAAADFMSGAARKGAWAQESDFLTGKRGVDMLVTDAFDMVMEKAFSPATFVDGLMSTLAVRGKYLQQIDAGKSHEEAMKAADEFGRKIMGSRVKGEKPVGFQSKRPVVQMLNLFQIEALNSWEHLSQDLPADFRAIEKQHGTKKAAAALAGVIVKMLLATFLLNRLGEEVYGGTPAPFDLIGLSANFIASGKGLTTNQWLKTVIDNGLEKLTGDRLLGTDPDAEREDFNWGDAFEDIGYNISNDIPFFRNIAGLMGWGDQTLPLPLMGAGQDLKYLFSDLKNDIEEGQLHGQTGMDLLRVINQALPGGRQLTKTLEGLQLMSQGGRYINDRLYYPVDSDMGTWIKALLFGRSSLYASDSYYAGDNKSLTTAQTEMYRQLVRDGADRFEVYQTIQDYKAITSDEDLGSYERGRRAREAITNADLTDEQRLALFRGMSSNNENRAEDFGEVMESGLTWAETVRAYDKWAELNANEDMTNREKAEAYAAWVSRQDYTEAEEEAVREAFRFWQSIPITDTKVDKFTDAGMETDAAEQLSETLRSLQPLPGNTQVTDLQRYQAIADSGLSVEDQWTAIVAQTNPSYTSTLAKIEIYRQQGITPSVWVASKQAMYAADDAGNNNDSTDQSEARAALDGMDIPIWQKAILWQTTNKSWKPNKNPYDREIGQAIYDQMHGGAAASASSGTTYTTPGGASFTINPNTGSQGGSTGGLELGTWGDYSYTTDNGVTFTIPQG